MRAQDAVIVLVRPQRVYGLVRWGLPMDFGIVTAKVDEIGYITHAENLGYTLLGHG